MLVSLSFVVVSFMKFMLMFVFRMGLSVVFAQ